MRLGVLLSPDNLIGSFVIGVSLKKRGQGWERQGCRSQEGKPRKAQRSNRINRRSVAPHKGPQFLYNHLQEESVDNKNEGFYTDETEDDPRLSTLLFGALFDAGSFIVRAIPGVLKAIWILAMNLMAVTVTVCVLPQSIITDSKKGEIITLFYTGILPWVLAKALPMVLLIGVLAVLVSAGLCGLHFFVEYKWRLRSRMLSFILSFKTGRFCWSSPIRRYATCYTAFLLLVVMPIGLLIAEPGTSSLPPGAIHTGISPISIKQKELDSIANLLKQENKGITKGVETHNAR